MIVFLLIFIFGLSGFLSAAQVGVQSYPTPIQQPSVKFQKTTDPWQQIWSDYQVIKDSPEKTQLSILQSKLGPQIYSMFQTFLYAQKPDWKLVIQNSLPEEVYDQFIAGVRIKEGAIERHYQLQKNRQPVIWHIPLVYLWMAQKAEEIFTSRNNDHISRFKKEVEKLIAILPSAERSQVENALDDVLEQLANHDIELALLQTINAYAPTSALLNAHRDRLDAKPVRSIIIQPTKKIEMWSLRQFDAKEFNAKKLEWLKDFWSAVSIQDLGNYDDTANRVIATAEEMIVQWTNSNDEVLYHKPMNDFMRMFVQQLKQSINRQPLGLAAWFYGQLSQEEQTMWNNGQHFSPDAYSQWRGTEAEKQTIRLSAVRIAILGGLRDAELNDRAAQIQRINMLLQGWGQRLRDVPEIVALSHELEQQAKHIKGKAIVWKSIVQAIQKVMDPKDFQAICTTNKQWVDYIKQTPWDSVKEQWGNPQLPWGEAIARQANIPKDDKNNIMDNLVGTLLGEADQAAGRKPEAAGKLADGTVNPNRIVGDVLKGLFG